MRFKGKDIRSGDQFACSEFFSPQTVVQFLLLKRDDMGKSSSFAIEMGSL